MYAAKNGYPPRSLEELPQLQGYDNRLMDGWGRKIEYGVIDGKIVELTSRGRDGIRGGTGEDQDIVRRFALRDKHGHWNAPLCDWLPPNENGP